MESHEAVRHRKRPLDISGYKLKILAAESRIGSNVEAISVREAGIDCDETIHRCFSKQNLRCPCLAGAFTLVELLVVIGIISTLIAMLLPALNRAREEAKRAKCLSNLRQLTMAWASYADEHHGRLVSSDTIDITTWVTSGDGLNTIQQGALYPYVNSAGIYLCPNDTVHYFRTYSINGYLQSNWGYPFHAKKITDIRYPASTFVFIEEYDARGFNEDSFVVSVYPAQSWVDYPAPWHNRAGMLSFADGHAEAWPWKDLATSRISGHNAPGTTDLLQLQAWVGFPIYPKGYGP